MFDKRLMAMCPESKKYIVGNIICQWMELMMNAGMIFVIAGAVGKSGCGKSTLLDSLNEAVILKSLKEEAKEKTVLLVSHRGSTMRIADEIFTMENGRILTEDQSSENTNKKSTEKTL